VVNEWRAVFHAGLGLVNLHGGGRIDAPVEAEDAGGVVGLESIGLRRGGEDEEGVGDAGKVDQKRDSTLGRAEDGPIGRAGALEAGADDVLRLVGLVGLRNEAPAAGKLIAEQGRELWEGTDRETTDEIGGGAAIDDDLAGLVELGGLLGGKSGASTAKAYP